MDKFKLSLTLFFLFSLFFGGTLYAQDSILPIKCYHFNSALSYQSISEALKSVKPQRNFVFTSELHYNRYSLEIRKKFILYLASTKKLDKIALEADYAYGYEINHFFQTGDTVRFQNLYKLHPEMNVSIKTANFYKYYVRLKDIADSLHLNLIFYGIDVSLYGGYKGSIFSINNILTKCETFIFKDLIMAGCELIDKKKLRDVLVRKWLKNVNEKVTTYTSTTSKGLPDETFIELNNILFNMRQSLERKKSGLSREKCIAQNFMKYCSPDDYVYAQFGYGHVFRNSKSKYPSFGDKTFIDNLNDEDSYKNKSLIIQFMPWRGTELYFPLLSQEEIILISPIIENLPFPQLVDFRQLKSVKGCFDFAIIVDD